MVDLKGNRITYIGHSTFSLTTPSGQMGIIDPWVMTNPVCPETLKKVHKLDVIFLTHGHADHAGDLLALAKQHKPKLVTSFETYLWLCGKGFENKGRPMGKGGSQNAKLKRLGSCPTVSRVGPGARSAFRTRAGVPQR